MYVICEGAAVRRTQVDRTAETRRALLGAARELFAAHGYAATATDDVVQRAGVTRGALYHHFANKRDLFRAVAEQIEEEIDRQMRDAAYSGDGIWESIARGIDAFFDACATADVRRILLVDGPSVLGWETWHAIDARYALAQIEDSLVGLVEAGYQLPASPQSLALLVYGATLEAALYLAHAEDAPTARTEFRRGIQHLFMCLVQPEGP